MPSAVPTLFILDSSSPLIGDEGTGIGVGSFTGLCNMEPNLMPGAPLSGAPRLLPLFELSGNNSSPESSSMADPRVPLGQQAFCSLENEVRCLNTKGLQYSSLPMFI